MIGKVVRATVMVVPGYTYSTGMFCNTEKLKKKKKIK